MLKLALVIVGLLAAAAIAWDAGERHYEPDRRLVLCEIES